MNKLYYVIAFFFFSSFSLFAQTGGVSIGKDGEAAQENAILELVSTSKGVLIPRMTSDERNAIFGGTNESAKGLLVFDSTQNAFFFWDGTEWQAVASSNVKIVSGIPTYTGVTGELAFDGTNSILYVYSGSLWVKASESSSGSNISLSPALTSDNVLYLGAQDGKALEVDLSSLKVDSASQVAVEPNTDVGLSASNVQDALLELQSEITTSSSGGLTAVVHDESLDGTGAVGLPLGVADGGIESTHIADGAVTSSKLADNAVTNDKLADNAVTTNELANNAVTYGKMQVAAGMARLVGSPATSTVMGEISLGTGLSMSGTTLNATGVAATGQDVTSSSGTITIGNGTGAALTAMTVDLTQGAVTTNYLGAGAVTAAKIADNTITSSKLSGITTTGNSGEVLASDGVGGFTWSSAGAGTVTSESTAPTSPSAGDVYYNTTDNNLYYYNGTSWIMLDGVETGTETPTDGSGTEGQTYYDTTTDVYYVYSDGTWHSVGVSSVTADETTITGEGTSTSPLKLADISASSLLGRNSSADGTPGKITLGTGLSMSTTGTLSVDDLSTIAGVSGSGYLYNDGTSWSLSSGTGSTSSGISSIGLSLPLYDAFTTLTSSGSFTGSLTDQTANTVFAGPNGSDGTPSFRSLVSADIPDLDWSKITTGTPTTLAGYGITDAQTSDTDLTAIAALSGTGYLYNDGTSWSLSSGTGTSTSTSGVTSLSVASSNGFSGSFTSTTTPVLTMGTTVAADNLLKSDGTGIVAATEGTDYLSSTSTLNASNLTTGTIPSSAYGTSGTIPISAIEDISASHLLGRNSSTSGAPEEIALGTGLSMSTAGTLSVASDLTYTRTSTYGTLTLPISSSSATIDVATSTYGGLMSAADKTKLDNIEASANNYSLPAATTSTLGGIIVGNNLSVTTDGTLSVDDLATIAGVSGSGYLYNDGTTWSLSSGTSTSGVTSLSVASSNGFSGSFTSTTTPVLTMGTTVAADNLLKSDGTGIVAATAGTDYLNSTSTLNASNLTTGTIPASAYGTSGTIPISAISTTGGSSSSYLSGDGTWATAVSSISGTSPIVVTGTTTPVISIDAATTSSAGSMSAEDKTKLNAIADFTSSADDDGKVLTMNSTGDAATWETPTTVTASNGLTATDGDVALGGTLTATTTIDQDGNDLTFTTGDDGEAIVDGALRVSNTSGTRSGLFLPFTEVTVAPNAYTVLDTDVVLYFTYTSSGTTPFYLPTPSTENAGRVLFIHNITSRTITITDSTNSLTYPLVTGKGAIVYCTGEKWFSIAN